MIKWLFLTILTSFSKDNFLTMFLQLSFLLIQTYNDEYVKKMFSFVLFQLCNVVVFSNFFLNVIFWKRFATEGFNIHSYVAAQKP